MTDTQGTVAPVDHASPDQLVLFPPAPVVALDTDPALVAFGNNMRDLQSQLNELFPERDQIITQLMYAVLCREHVLLHGTYGTGKTELLTTLFSTFAGQQMFSIGLTKFMTEANLFGIPDPKLMREEGIIRYRRAGSALDADFTEFDEFFDASPPLQRTLLGLLNERLFKRGEQVEHARLHTAVASTNYDPAAMMRQFSELGPVVDRFMFQNRVGYLQQEESRLRMYRKVLGGERPEVCIEFCDLRNFSELVVGNKCLAEPDLLLAFDQMVQAHRKGLPEGAIISDRRACKLLMLPQASAVLHGRKQVHPEDLLAIRFGLPTIQNADDHKRFCDQGQALVEKLVSDRKQNIDEVQLRLLEQYHSQVPEIADAMTSDELIGNYRALNALRKQVEEVMPQLATTMAIRNELVAEIAQRSHTLNQRISGEG